MSHILTLELSDEAYKMIQHQAKEAGTLPAHWLAEILEQQYSDGDTGRSLLTPRSPEEQQAARIRFEQHFGEVDMVAAVGADNEQIDTDLADEYMDPSGVS